jgi:hypothetical protein
MGFFDPVIEAESLKQHVRCGLFFECQFKSQTLYIWEGDGTLTRDGHDWQGLGPTADPNGQGPIVQIDNLEQSINGTANSLMITFSGVDSRITSAASQDSANQEIEGQKLKVSQGWFRTDVEALLPLGSMLPMGTWLFQKPAFITDGPKLRTIQVACETLFVQRSRGPYGMWTDRDQQRRFPGDTGCNFIPVLVNTTVTWPQF